MKRTSRGFAIFGEYKDSKRQLVRIQKSSSIREAVWIFCQDSAGNSVDTVPGYTLAKCPHLTRHQARLVAKALLRFADGER